MKTVTHHFKAAGLRIVVSINEEVRYRVVFPQIKLWNQVSYGGWGKNIAREYALSLLQLQKPDYITVR